MAVILEIGFIINNLRSTYSIPELHQDCREA